MRVYRTNGPLVFICISVFSRRTKMHSNGMLLIGTEFFKIIVP